jgi:hypothetical protein
VKSILFLCRIQDLNRERFGYAKAFRKRKINLVCVPDNFPVDGDLRALLDRYPDKPSLIIQPETVFPILPWDLTETSIPTACFQIDVYAYTRHRIRWSMLFDYAILFHPGFDEQFRQAGHPKPLTLPHAVDAETFEKSEGERDLEVGWVGRADGPLYKTRRKVLHLLSQHFRMNEWWRPYTYEEMAKVYQQSKIAVNVGRDDYLQDANLRVFEAMAAGALLITQLPSELILIGFEPNVHFVGYESESDLLDLVRYYLSNEKKRQQIAEAGREKVLKEHTYDARVKTLLSMLEQDKGRLFAPARNWSQDQVRLLYADWFSAHGRFREAWRCLVGVEDKTSAMWLHTAFKVLARQTRFRVRTIKSTLKRVCLI